MNTKTRAPSPSSSHMSSESGGALLSTPAVHKPKAKPTGSRGSAAVSSLSGTLGGQSQQALPMRPQSRTAWDTLNSGLMAGASMATSAPFMAQLQQIRDSQGQAPGAAFSNHGLGYGPQPPLLPGSLHNSHAALVYPTGQAGNYGGGFSAFPSGSGMGGATYASQPPMTSPMSSRVLDHPMLVLEAVRDAHRRIYSTQQAVRQQPALVPYLRPLDADLASLRNTLTTIGAAVEYYQRTMEGQQATAANLREIIKRGSLENDSYVDQIGNLKSEITRLQKQIEYLEDQLNAKRDIWMGMPRDPRETALVQRLANDHRPSPADSGTSSAYLGGDSGESSDHTAVASSAYSWAATSVGSDRRPTSRHGRPQSSHASRPASRHASQPGHAYRAASSQGPPPPITPSRAAYTAGNQHQHSANSQYGGSRSGRRSSVANNASGQARYDFGSQSRPGSRGAASFPPVKDDTTHALDDETAAYAGKFSTLFDMVIEFCHSYCRDTVDPSIAAKAPKLWEYMCEALYPGKRRNAESHARHLLSNATHLRYLAARLVIQYIVNQMLSAEGWFDFDKQTEDELTDIQEQLQDPKVSTTYERQELVDRRVAILNRILRSPRFPEFQQNQNQSNSQKLKLMTRPLVKGDGESLRDSQHDLNTIVVTARKLSAEMLQSKNSFQFVWNDTCSKFTVESHNALENETEPMQLQLKQMRLMLVVTPGVTMRDDSGLNIIPKRIRKSDVLIMA